MFLTLSIVASAISKNQKDYEIDVAKNSNKLTKGARLAVCFILGDTFLSITALVIGILGAVGTLHGMPSAAAYTLISVSGVISLSWIFMVAMTKGEVLKVVKHCLKASVSSNPRLYLPVYSKK